ncbi:energy transducer TonB [Umboniibacter marinipuniceus]|uniref:TonB family protein n=1 Tax=Umboniibacter marinipuniceus TaxID=569599 RepID=A0A3M0ACI9_9GAMM|nr:energy transducer TonB [Umboniibacter marinipuniceus]RMA82650.1 TonB family protein [Umboniibacter marinipuniceus]
MSFLLIVTICLIVPCVAQAQTNPFVSPSIPTSSSTSSSPASFDYSETEPLIPARRLDRDSLVYSSYELGLQYEGWVVVSSVIDPEGQVVKVIIDNSSGNIILEEAARELALNAKFAPAMLYGRAVRSSVNQQQYRFNFNDGVQGLSPFYRSANSRALSAYGEGDWERFQQSLEALANMQRRNFMEEAHFSMLVGLSLERQGDRQGALRQYQQAIDWNIEQLSEERAVVAYQHAFSLLVESENYPGAVSLANRIPPTLAPLPQLQYTIELSEQLRQHIAGQVYLENQLVLDEEGRSSLELWRQTFDLSLTEGTLDAYELWCSGRYMRYTFTANTSTSIPRNWGDCTLRLEGKPGARVSVWQSSG